MNSLTATFRTLVPLIQSPDNYEHFGSVQKTVLIVRIYCTMNLINIYLCNLFINVLVSVVARFLHSVYTVYSLTFPH